jgi:hypothetical protein
MDPAARRRVPGEGAGQDVVRRLSEEDVEALRFAVQRQQARWKPKRFLPPRHVRLRASLGKVSEIINEKQFSHGCELHASGR